MQVEIDFTPTCVDVVSTKNRTWNLKHSGNMFYTRLVHSRVIELKDFEDLAAFRRVAEEIVDTIVVERGGRFLKLKDGERNSTRCRVMKLSEATNKVIHALRSAHLKLNLQNIPGVVSQPMKKLNVAKTINKSQAPRGLARSKRSSAERVFYQAEEGKQPIHKYALYLISLVCNQADPAIAYQILNKPSQEYNVDTEPEKERLMRLQVSDITTAFNYILSLSNASPDRCVIGMLQLQPSACRLWSSLESC